MGNQQNCFAKNMVKSSALEQIPIEKKYPSYLETHDEDISFSQQSHVVNMFSILNGSTHNSLGFEKLNKCRIFIQKMDTVMMETMDIDEQKLQQKIQDQPIYCTGNTLTQLRDYISFKKYSPKIHYNFESMISSTKNSKIYLAINRRNNIKRVIKVDKPKTTGQEIPSKTNNLLHFMKNLDHPNIIRFYSVYEYKERKYFVMEHMQGGSLKDVSGCRMRARLFGQQGIKDYFNQLKIIIKQVLYTLCYLHDKKICHLNIKSKRILLSSKFGSKKVIFCKLIGFGSALSRIGYDLTKVKPEIKSALLQQFELIPPQVTQQSSVCLKTDIWMLGFVIFQTVTKIKINNIPLRSEKPDGCTIMRTYMTNIWNKLQQNLHFQQKKCLDLILKMVQKNKDNRPSALECLEHGWFNSIESTSPNRSSRQSSHQVFKNLASEKKSNNLISYIESLIIYKNISHKEMALIAQIFEQLDKDKDGTVAIQQLIQYFQSEVDTNLGKEQTIFDFCLELISNFDDNGSGTIDYHQFTKVLVDKQKLITKQSIQEIFDHIDMDGNGHIIFEELKGILNFCNLEELEYYMKKMDKDYDGKIKKQQFVSYCMEKFEESGKLEVNFSSDLSV